MKLYLAPGACSLADHIALHEAGLAFERVRVDLRAKRTEDGRDFNEINPKGYVPALVLDDGQLLTENVAILCWVAERAPELAPDGELGRIRLLEMLAFIATELHKPFVRASSRRATPRSRPPTRSSRGALASSRIGCRATHLFASGVQRRRRLPLRHAALGADEGAGPARAAAGLLRAGRCAPRGAARAAARRADLKAFGRAN